MFSTRSFRSSILVFAALLAAFAVAAGNAAAADVTSADFAFNFGDPTDSGHLTMNTTCDHARHSGTVSLAIQTPRYSTPNGLYLYTNVWVKNRAQSWSTALLLDQRQQFVASTNQTIMYAGTMTSAPESINLPRNLFSRTFTGANWNYYDVAVTFNFARPGTPWSQAFTLYQNQYFAITGAYGYGIPANVCML